MGKRQVETGTHDPSGEAELPSKSQRKRDALAVRSLAAELIDLPNARLQQVPLDEDVRQAVRETRQIRSNIARKRQLQYVAKLLRHEDLEPVAEALEAMRGEARQLTARHHRAEGWRDHLLAGGDPALSGLIAACPDIDPQSIRQCLRAAAREARDGKPPAAARRLFRLLREYDELRPLPRHPLES